MQPLPPPPWTSGINELVAECDLIYGRQQVTGKILRRKELAWRKLSKSGRYSELRIDCERNSGQEKNHIAENAVPEMGQE
jgi:hypothetical protein